MIKGILLSLVFGLVGLVGFATAAPFLVCSPDPVVETYLIKVNGAAAIEVAAPLHWDVGPLPDGQYDLEVAAKNMWGQSSYVPFVFNKAVPQGPQGIGLSAE